jgi:hypothetical protein
MQDNQAKGPDYSAVTSREHVADLTAKGELIAMLMMPEALGGRAVPENLLYVPPFVAELKIQTDERVIYPMIRAGNVTRYNVEPVYSGRSFVPIAVKIHASEPGKFSTTIRIWGDGLVGA